MTESRVKKSLLNARVNLVFYFLSLILSFFFRKIFLDTLGADFLGLTGTLYNLLGFLNLAELGIGGAIGYVLYKPLFEKDETKISEIISVFGYLYRWIGLIILGAGCLLACFLPLIFPSTGFQFGIIYFAYFSFLTSSLIGYFANYKQTLLGADQRNYVVTAYFQTATIIKTLIQMACAYYTGNYYLWVVIELIFGIIYSVILNWKVNQVYPWLKSNISEGKNKYQDNKIIITKAKQMFVHLLASTGRNQILPFLIYAFASLKIVAYYGNYMVIIDKIAGFVNQFLGSTTAGVGNLIAENNKEKTLQIYWEFITLRFFVAGVLIFSLYNLIEPFVQLWLGNEYILDNKVFIIILCNIFVSLTRGTNDQFISGYGLFHDIWAPIATLFLTIGVALICGSMWGLFGVLLGDITSSIIIINIWKPYFLFKQGFNLSVRKYWKQIFKNLMMLLIVWICSSCILHFISINPYHNYKTWIMYAFLITALFSCLYFGGMLLINKNSVKGLIMRIVTLKK